MPMPALDWLAEVLGTYLTSSQPAPTNGGIRLKK